MPLNVTISRNTDGSMKVSVVTLIQDQMVSLLDNNIIPKKNYSVFNLCRNIIKCTVLFVMKTNIYRKSEEKKCNRVK